MRGKILWVGLVLTSMFVIQASAAVTTVPLQADRTALDLVETRNDTYQYRVNIGELQALDVETTAGGFTRLVIPGFHNSMRDGAPELPMMNRLIEMPRGARARVEILSSKSRVMSLADFGVTQPLMPHQPSLSKSVDAANVAFVYDRAAYDVDKVGQELVRVVELGNLRSRGVARVEVSPIEYLPRSGEIVVHEDIEFRVTFEGSDRKAEAEELARVWSPFFEPVFARIDGSRTNHFDYPDLVQNKVTMVVVTPPEFQYNLTNFVNWKTERGFNTILAVMGTPEVGSTSASIRTYLYDLYNSATPANPAPSFVLFVGDVAQCPTFTEAGDATDRPYCDVDGDMFPDMYYGRFSATNASQLQAQLDKTMMYDQFTMPDPSYLGNVTMIAGVDASWAPTHGNGQINYGTEHYFNASHGITSNTYLYPASDAAGAPAEIVQTCNDGIGYINYTAHGSQTSWSDPSFTQSDINGLTNAGKYFLAVGNCCLTSSYDYAECFGETWLRAANKGAVGYIGGSNSTYWDEDYWWGVGYHAASQIDGTAWPVASTGVGVYDGVFHDNGEAEDQWYVTNDAIIFCGNLAVTESGSSRELYYWNIYNLLGDPSLSTYMGVPAVNPVSVLPLFSNATTLNIIGAPGSYVGLTQGGVVFASGTIAASGGVVLTIDGALTPGSAKLVVTAQNHEPFIENVPVIVPATITFDPTAVDANVATPVTITIVGADGVTPEVGVMVWAEGLDYLPTAVETDVNGQAVLTIDYPYGPAIAIAGSRPGEGYELFRQPLTVNALPLTMADLTVSTDIGMIDMFPLNLSGTLHMTVTELGAQLYGYHAGQWFSTSASELVIYPTELGSVTGVIAVSGYDQHIEIFDVVEAYGQLTGHVVAAGDEAGAVVRLFDTGGVEVATATCDASGAYDFGGDILVDDYVLTVDIFGYLHFEDPFFLNYGPNIRDAVMTPAPSGVLNGYLHDSVSGDPIEGGIVRVFRSDNNSLISETATDVLGAYTSAPLPYFEYRVNVRAYQHVPVTIMVEIDQPSVLKSFVLEPTNGDLLIVDDGGAAKVHQDKYDEKANLLAGGYASDGGKSAVFMGAALELMGFSVAIEDVATTDPGSWSMYDVVIMACGDNTATLADIGIRNAMLAHVDAGYKLLLEGGEVGYDHYSSGAFAERVLHSTDWNHDASGLFQITDPTHHVMSVPNAVEDNASITYNGYGDQDAMAVLPDAEKIGHWGTYPEDASVIAYDPNPAPEGGQIVYFCFNFASLATGCGNALLENAVHWLLTPEFGSSSVSGQVLLLGETNHSGILVEAVPAGGQTFTAADGSYTLPGLYAGEYVIRASKNGWGTRVVDVTLTSGENLAGVDMVLTPVFQVELCSAPGLAIPDNNPVGISDVIAVALHPTDPPTVSAVEVFIDVTHTWQGDLLVTLTSPSGISVVLHNRTGSSTDNIYGWYPGDLVPAGDLDLFVGEATDGDWRLSVSDNAGADLGTLNQWCLKITYSGVVAIGDEEGSDMPLRYALHPNYPNPFNPTTTITFELPKPGKAVLSVYDLQGRLVKVLKNEVLTAAIHSVRWDGTNSSGARVASGSYYLRMQANEYEAVHKMMLLK